MANKRSKFESEHLKFHKADKKKNIGELAKFHDHTSDEEIVDHNFHTGHRFALVGNPNCGKTTLFNYLTGSSQYVGNWPGVTVEKKEGRAKMGGENLNIIDLPGIYSLSPYSPEEVVARNFIINEHPDLIINIIDATNLERNMYLTTQLLELGVPVIVALNMYDVITSRGDVIDVKNISESIGVPVVPISANKGTGIMELMHIAHELAEKKTLPEYIKIYRSDVSAVLSEISVIIHEECDKQSLPVLWSAVKIFENDPLTLKRLGIQKPMIIRALEISKKIPVTGNIDHEILIADQRYKYIESICSKAVKRKTSIDTLSISDKIDRYVTGKYTAIPIFLIAMLTIFFLTFGPVGSYLTDLVDGFFSDTLSPAIGSFLKNVNASDWAIGLVCDGILAGVGSVISFLPQISILFFFMSVLEDSGYMSRAAFIMDRALRKIGLSGKSFVPILMGFGCTVPAVMCTRTLENDKDRRLTILLTPFMSCPAKMPVYSLIIAAFFPRLKAVVIMGLYALGIVLAILTGLLLSRTAMKGEASHFVMELPPYRIPTAKSLFLHMWDRIKDFLSKAGTVILIATAAVWFLQSYNFSLHAVTNSEESILSSIGKIIAPIFKPCGFGNWQSAVSLLTGVMAKEQIVSTMSVLGGGGTGINSILGSQLGAFSFLVFVLLYTPCMASLTTISKEMKSKKWTAFSIIYQLFVAWFISMLVFNLGTVLGF